MTEHTFERLVLRAAVFSDATAITNERGFMVVEVPLVATLIRYHEKLNIDHWADDKRAYTEFTQEQQAANARRIVACVNFCAGVSTENLLNNNPLMWLARQYNTVKCQRDEVLSVLEELFDIAELDSDVWERVDAAIKKVKAELKPMEVANDQ